MGISLKVIIYLLSAGVNLFSAKGNKGGSDNIMCDNTPVTLTAYLGGSVTIKCNYTRARKNITVKHFCREDEKAHCTNLISTYAANYTKRDRFSLADDKQQGVLTVTISSITQDDAGRYQCAEERSDSRPTACLTEIHLFVLYLHGTILTEKNCNNVTIDCPYQASYQSNEKFLCKGENPFDCDKLIQTTGDERHSAQGRYHIKDDKRLNKFYVSIKNATTTDSGTYWCGSDRTRHYAGYIKVLLTVADDSRCSKTRIFLRPRPTPSHTRPEDGWPQNIAITGGVIGCVALLLIFVAALLLIRYKLSRAQGCEPESEEQGTNHGHNTEENHGDHDYEETQMQNQQARLGDVLPSVYATANMPADQLHYARINFKKNSVRVSTDCNALRVSGTPPAAEQTLYSTLTAPGKQ